MKKYFTIFNLKIDMILMLKRVPSKKELSIIKGILIFVVVMFIAGLVFFLASVLNISF